MDTLVGGRRERTKDLKDAQKKAVAGVGKVAWSVQIGRYSVRMTG